MKRDSLDRLVDRWHTDPEFRSAFRADLEATLASEGIELNDEERAALHGLELDKITDTELEERISKGLGNC